MNKVQHLLVSLLSLAAVLGAAMGNGQASPADVFQPHLESIQQQLPPGYQLRLPSEILLGGPGLSPEDMRKLIVRVERPESEQVTISLLTCEGGPYPCLIGSFTLTSANSLAAQRMLYLHSLMYAPVTLDKDVQAYLQEGSQMNPPSDYSSAMWQQDGMIYSVKFLAAERQNILFMARSMALQSPIGSEAASH